MPSNPPFPFPGVAQGPSLPANMGSDDAPGVMLPDGHFIFVADTSSPQVFSAPSIMLDYDYTTNTVTDITSTLPSTLQNTLAASSAYVTRFLMLPNGHALFNDGNGGLWEYAPTGAPQSTWRPTITSITKGTGGNPVYTLTGTQLTGLWQGASYGDDAEMDTNYPIVSIVGPSPANTVHYARTTNWTPGISSVGSTTKTTVQFTLPAGLANGTYKLYVSANGISSAAFTFTLPYTNAAPSNYVTASYSAGTLTLTDDAADNAVVVTQQGTILTVQGAGTTLIKVGANSSQSATFNVGSTVNVTGNFTNGGNNTVSFVSVNSPNLTLTFGSGNDTTNLTYSTIGILTLDGGAGTDNLVPVTTKITTKHVTNVP